MEMAKFYCFKNSSKAAEQKSSVIECKLEEAHKLFNEEYTKKQKGRSEWDYFDITVKEGKLLRSSNK